MPTEIIARARARDRIENSLAECLSPVQTAHGDHSQGQGQRQDRDPLAECLSLVQTAHRDHSKGQGKKQERESYGKSVCHQYRSPTEIIVTARERRENPLSECLSPVQTAHRDHSKSQGQRQERESAIRVSLTSKDCPHIS